MTKRHGMPKQLIWPALEDRNWCICLIVLFCEEISIKFVLLLNVVRSVSTSKFVLNVVCSVSKGNVLDVVMFLNKLYCAWTILFWTKITWIMLLTVTASSVWSEQQGFYWVPLQVNYCFDQFWCDKLSNTIFSCNLRHYKQIIQL